MQSNNRLHFLFYINLKKTFKYIILIFITVIFIASCSENNEIIEKDKLVIILTDLHKTNAILGDKKLLDVNLKREEASYYNYFFKKHNITQAQFEKTLDYYSNNLKIYISIYDEVLLNINKEEASFAKSTDKIFRVPQFLKDSIAKKLADDALWVEIWNKKKNWVITKDTLINSIIDTITIKKWCKLKLSADILIYKDDSYKKHCIMLKAFYEDKTIDTLINKTLIVDEKFHNYNIETKTDSIKILDSIICRFVNYPDSIKSRHLKINNITIKKYIINLTKNDTIIHRKIKKDNRIPLNIKEKISKEVFKPKNK